MDIFHSPITLAHHFWEQILSPGDLVIDATCGNGKDTEFLANLVLKQDPIGTVIGLDIQEQAINATFKRLSDTFTIKQMEHVHLSCQSHASFPTEHITNKLKLIVYNLGYLPGGDKQLTTMLSTTMESISNAMNILPVEGFLSITFYPGHPEGKRETEVLTPFFQSLSSKEWMVSSHIWQNRLNSPILFIIKKYATNSN